MKNIAGQKVTKEMFLQNLGSEMLIAGGVLMALSIKELIDASSKALADAIERRRWRKRFDEELSRQVIKETLAGLTNVNEESEGES